MRITIEGKVTSENIVNAPDHHKFKGHMVAAEVATFDIQLYAEKIYFDEETQQLTMTIGGKEIKANVLRLHTELEPR